MKKTTNSLIYLNTFFLMFALIAISCGCESDNSPKEPKEEEEPISATPVIFTAIGDVPYNDNQRTNLTALISTHNAKSESEFVIHVGDIKPGADPCDEAVYADVSTLLKGFKAPTFIILGDNEFNDCEYPEQSLDYWNQYFLNFNKNWQFEHTISYQQERLENFAWTANEVLFIGINLVGSSIHDQEEWSARLQDDADWVQGLLAEHKDDTKAAVVFAHANVVNFGPVKFEAFTDTFRASAALYDQPILFLHGDGHHWIENRPWPEQNILRLQINGGSEAIQVTVDTAKENTFNFDTTFLE